MDLESARLAWAGILGSDSVLTGAAVQQEYGHDCSAITRAIPIALRVHDRTQVLPIVQVAQRYQVPIYPISTGRNWGYGTALPVNDGCALLDLSRLNRIIDFDAQLGVVTVEPGVTQAALGNFLDAGGHPFMVPTTGAGPEGSLLGNALERGFGVTPHADHFSAVTDIEAVLADGTLYTSALREMAGEDLARLFKWGIGPYFSGLFSQGRLGVVTRLSIVLARQPASVRVMLFSLTRDDLLEPAITAVQTVLCRLPGIVGGINLMNQHRTLAMTSDYPYDRVEPQGVMSAALVTELGRRQQLLPWTGFGTLYGTPGVVAAAKREIRRALRGIATRLIFVSERQAQWIVAATKRLPGSIGKHLSKTAASLAQSVLLASGRPSHVALPLAYWRNAAASMPPRHPDPSRDGSGLIWYAPLVPMRPALVREFLIMVHSITRAHGIEPLITLTSLNDRLFECTVPLLFSRTDANAAAAAVRCFDRLWDAGLHLGVCPYRLGVDAMKKYRALTPRSSEQHGKLLAGIDPTGILSPGRYA